MPFLHTPRRPSPVQSQHRKTAHALRANATAFIDHHGLDHCGFLTATFTQKIWPAAASQRLKKVVRSFHGHFTDWIWTMGLGNSFRIHYHVLFSCHQDIRAGIDLSAYRQLLSLEDGYDALSLWITKATVPIQQRRKELRAALSNQALKGLRSAIFPRLRAAGFGQQIHLSPIFTDGPTIAAYMHSNYMEAVRGRNASFRGQRLVGYKQGSLRSCLTSFAWTGHRQWRVACHRIAHAHGVTDYSDMCPTFGPKWGHRIRYLMAELQSRYGDSPHDWPASAIVELSAHTMPRITESPCGADDDDLQSAA